MNAGPFRPMASSARTRASLHCSVDRPGTAAEGEAVPGRPAPGAGG
jgi:hypothetical protein